MTDLAKDARDAAAKATGLRPDQIEAAVEEYRKASESLHEEPEWTALMHVSYRDGSGIGQYRDPAGKTEILLQIETGKRGDGVKVYVLNETGYDTYGEARAIELVANARTKPRSITAGEQPK